MMKAEHRIKVQSGKGKKRVLKVRFVDTHDESKLRQSVAERSKSSSSSSVQLQSGLPPTNKRCSPSLPLM